MTQARDGPVQFEKDAFDPFNIDEMIRDVTGGAAGGSAGDGAGGSAGDGAGSKRYGVQETYSGASKRARIDENDGPT